MTYICSGVIKFKSKGNLNAGEPVSVCGTLWDTLPTLRGFFMLHVSVVVFVKEYIRKHLSVLFLKQLIY